LVFAIWFSYSGHIKKNINRFFNLVMKEDGKLSFPFSIGYVHAKCELNATEATFANYYYFFF